MPAGAGVGAGARSGPPSPLAGLVALKLYSAGITGELDESISELTSLKILSIWNNSISGPLVGMQTLTALQELDVSGNRLKGE